MEPGDAIFPQQSAASFRPEPFQTNHAVDDLLLQRGSQRSYKESHAAYTPLKVVADSAIKEVGIKRFGDDASDVSWLQDEKDRSARLLERKPVPQ